MTASPIAEAAARFMQGEPVSIIVSDDLKPVLIQMAKDALMLRKLMDGHRVRTGCRDEVGDPCPECVIDVQRQREYREVLTALGGSE